MVTSFLFLYSRFTLFFFFFFFNDTATTEIYTLSLHDALPICPAFDHRSRGFGKCIRMLVALSVLEREPVACYILRHARSEEHTSELQSLTNLVCRLLLEKKKKLYDSHL